MIMCRSEFKERQSVRPSGSDVPTITAPQISRGGLALEGNHTGTVCGGLNGNCIIILLPDRIDHSGRSKTEKSRPTEDETAAQWMPSDTAAAATEASRMAIAVSLLTVSFSEEARSLSP